MAAKITANPLERMRRSQGRRVRIAVVSCPRRLSGAGSPMNSFVKADTEAAVSFGPFIFYRQQRLVTRDGEPLALGGRALDILQVLMENAGHFVSKQPLIARVWPDSVEEALNKIGRAHV